MIKQIISLPLNIKCPVHDDEKVSYYCLEQQCKESKLLCVLCAFTESQQSGISKSHKNHEMQPIKYFLQEICKDMETVNNNICLIAKIDTLKQQLTSTCEAQQIIKEEKIYEMLQIALEQYFNKIEAQTNFQVINLIKKCFLNQDALSFYGLIEQYIELWRKNYSEEKKEQSTYIRMIHSIISDIEQKNQAIQEIIKKGDIDVSIVEMFSSQTSSKKFYFSPKLMHSQLTFVEKTKVKITNYADYNYFALCQPAISPHKVQKITFKMTSLSSYVTLGICIKSKVDGDYNFMSGSLGHGSFQISYDGYLWSDCDSSVNQQYSGWYYNQGDSVTVEVNPKIKNIRFIKNGDQANAKQMKYDCKKNDKLHFCVSLNSEPEEVDIVY